MKKERFNREFRKHAQELGIPTSDWSSYLLDLVNETIGSNGVEVLSVRSIITELNEVHQAIITIREQIARLPDQIRGAGFTREMPDGYKTVLEVSKLKGLTTHRIRQAITDGIIPAEKIGRDWIISDEIADRYTPLGRGRRTPRLTEVPNFPPFKH